MSAHILLDSDFIDKIILEVKSQGLFDSFRKECLADVDTQPAYQNLHSRVEDTVQRFLNRQVWTPEIKNKNRLREDMRMNIIRAGFLESGVSRIVDQVVEQKMEKIQNKVEEILYKYAGIEKPKKGDKNNSLLEIDTTLLPTDLEQVSPDSDKKSESLEKEKELLEEEIIDDDDFESPAFEPIEPLKTESACQNSHISNLSEISSQDSVENKLSNKSEELITFDGKDKKPDTALSQISSTQDNIVDITDTPVACVALTGISGEEAQMAFNDSTEQGNSENKEKNNDSVFQFDLNKDTIEFTGTERKSINMNLDDSTNSGESEKVNQALRLMEVDNIYENDTTDSSEMRMEIDLKDETTQGTVNSSKKEENSQDSQKKYNKNDCTKDKSSKSHQHRYSSSSSKSKYDEKSHHRIDKDKQKKDSNSHERRSSNSTKHRDYDKKSVSSSKSSRTKHGDQKIQNDDHHQEKNVRRHRSTDDDDSKDIARTKEISCEIIKSLHKNIEKNSNDKESSSKSSYQDNKNQNKNSKQNVLKNKDVKSSILAKYDYLKLKEIHDDDKNESELRGFEKFTDETKNSWIENPWFECMRLVTSKKFSFLSNNNYIDEATNSSTKKLKVKTSNTSDFSDLNNIAEESTIQQKNHTIITQQQRYDSKDLYKPKFDFRRGRRGQINDESSNAKTPESN